MQIQKWPCWVVDGNGSNKGVWAVLQGDLLSLLLIFSVLLLLSFLLNVLEV